MSKYKDGKIYKLTSSFTNMMYIGSTIQSLNDRLRIHRCNKSNNTNSHLITKYNDFTIHLIENYPCNTKRELLEREGHYIRLHFDICVNKVIPCRTDREYYEDNKEHIKEQTAKYRKENSEIIKEKKAKFRKDNREKLRKYDKERYYRNKANGIKRVISEETKRKDLERRRERYRRLHPPKPKPPPKSIEVRKQEKHEYDMFRKFWINSFGGRIDNKSYNNNLLHISMDLFH
jgi:hypothetical protein